MCNARLMPEQQTCSEHACTEHELCRSATARCGCDECKLSIEAKRAALTHVHFAELCGCATCALELAAECVRFEREVAVRAEAEVLAERESTRLDDHATRRTFE